MISACRRCACLAAIFVMVAVSSIAAGCGSKGRAAWRDGSVGRTPDSSSATTGPRVAGASPARAEAVSAETGDESGESYEFRYSFSPDTPLYYVVENEFRDSGSVPGWLSYSTSVKDRRVIIQHAQPCSERGPSAPAKAGRLDLTWECDRYEIREKGMKSEVAFDSLRDLYPPPSLYGLSGVPGSRTSFLLDPRTGRASEFKVTPGKPGGSPPTTGRLSRTASRCSLTTQMLESLLYDLGPGFLPTKPVRVGSHWIKEQTESLEPFGTISTSMKCTLRSVRDVGEEKIATIDLSGEIKLRHPPKDQPQSASQPASAKSPDRPNHDVPPEAVFPPPESSNHEPRGDRSPTSRPADGGRPGPPPLTATVPPSLMEPPTTRPDSTKPSGTTTKPTTTGPTSRSARQEGKASKTKPFLFDTAVCTGSVEFNLTRGELVRLNLRQDLNGATKLEQATSDPLIPTEIRVGSFHELRVAVSSMPPPKPIIPGGPRPPVIPPEELEQSKGNTPLNHATTQKAAMEPATRPGMPATQPSHRESLPAKLPPTTRPAFVGPPSPGQPAVPASTTQPDGLLPSRWHAGPTTRPAPLKPNGAKPGVVTPRPKPEPVSPRQPASRPSSRPSGPDAE